MDHGECRCTLIFEGAQGKWFCNESAKNIPLFAMRVQSLSETVKYEGGNMRPRNLGKQIVRTEHTNLETGEITYSQEKKVDMQFSERKGFLYKPRENYVKRFLDSSLPEGLSWVDQGKLARLQIHIIGSSQLIGRRSGGRFVPLGIQDMSKIFRCKERSTYYTIQNAKKFKVLKEVTIAGVCWYAFNPLYGLKDKRISLETYLIFQEELSDMLPDWVKRNFMQQAEGLPDLPIVIH